MDGQIDKKTEMLEARVEALEKELEEARSWNPLYKKKIYFLGSSWTYGLGCNGRDNFAMRIAERNHMTYVNESASYTTYVPREGRTDSYYERADLLPDEKPDYVLLQMSSNDPRHTDCPVGHVTEFYYEDPEQGQLFDLQTISGAMEATISKLMRRWPGAKFAWLTGFKGPAPNEKTRVRGEEMYRMLIDELAPKWGTPVCDLTRRLGLNTFIPENRELLTIGDGQHCVSAGYECWDRCIESFLKML